MIARNLARLCLAAIALASAPAHAIITCNVSSAGFATAYSPTAGATNVTQGFFTVTCTRGSAADPTSVDFSNRADNGLYALGQNNRAAFGASRIRYDVFRNATCSTTWKGNGTIDGTIMFSGTGTQSATFNFWGCVPAGQTGLPAGTYTDTVTMTLSYGPNPQATSVGSFPVSVSTPAMCTLGSPPGNVVFNYVSLGGPVAASSTFGVTCTNALPYTMALDATSGTLLGLNYTLALSAASSVGTGSQQTHTINGNMPGGQAGTCAAGTCSATEARVLTISY